MSNEDIPPCSKSVRITTNEYIALVRDARRFRRMEKAHDGPTNTAWCKAAHYRDGLFKQWDVVITPLAEIADALPEVEKP